MNLAVVNDIYSGMKAPKSKPIALITREIINAIFLPSLSEIYPNTYDAINNALIVNVAVKNT